MQPDPTRTTFDDVVAAARAGKSPQEIGEIARQVRPNDPTPPPPQAVPTTATARQRVQMPSGAYTWYVILNILTLGGFYFAKLIVMKALIDAENVKNGF